MITKLFISLLSLQYVIHTQPSDHKGF